MITEVRVCRKNYKYSDGILIVDFGIIKGYFFNTTINVLQHVLVTIYWPDRCNFIPLCNCMISCASILQVTLKLSLYGL